MALFGTRKKKISASSEIKAGAVAAASPGMSYSHARTLIRPRVTEKGTVLMEAGVYTFEIISSATKHEVSKAIKALYGVLPRKVNIVKRPPHTTLSRMRGKRGTAAGIKKAYVYLKKGDRIEIV